MNDLHVRRLHQLLVDLEHKLTDWEQGFAESCLEQVEQGGVLSEAQRRKITEIFWEKQ